MTDLRIRMAVSREQIGRFYEGHDPLERLTSNGCQMKFRQVL